MTPYGIMKGQVLKSQWSKYKDMINGINGGCFYGKKIWKKNIQFYGKQNLKKHKSYF